MSETSSKTARVRLINAAFGTIACVLLVLVIFAVINASGHRPHQGKSTTLATAIAIESAINNFHTEYGVLPVVGSHIQTDGPDGVKFLNILLGLEGDSTQKQNSRGIKFLSVREARNGRNGLQYDGKGSRVQGLYDLWGNPFIVEINAKNEDKLRFKSGERNIELPGRLAAVYSSGKDGKPGTSDDAVTWNQ
jgi:hypothetical protein